MFPKLAISKTYDVSAMYLWKLIIDTRTWTRWGPSIRKIECTDVMIQSGTSGRLQTPLGIWLSFKVTDFTPPNYWAWRVGNIPATGHRIESLDPHHCRLAFTLPLWAAGYLPVCRIALNRIHTLLN